jgi:O-antigen ligase
MSMPHPSVAMAAKRQIGRWHFIIYGLLLFCIYFDVNAIPGVSRLRLIIAGILFITLFFQRQVMTALVLLANSREVLWGTLFMAFFVLSAWVSGNRTLSMGMAKSYFTSFMLMTWAYMLVRYSGNIRRMICVLAIVSAGQAVLNLSVTLIMQGDIVRMASVMKEDAGATMNSIGETASWGVALSFYLFATSQRMKSKLFWSVFALLGIVAIFATGCRGAIVLLFMMFATQTFFLRKHLSRDGTTFLVIMIGIILAIHFLSRPEFEAPVARVLTLVEKFGNYDKMDTFESRRPAADAAMKMWASSPFVGVGTGSFVRESMRYKRVHDRQFAIGPHNMYLMLLAENGLLGLLLFFTVMLVQAIPLLRYLPASLFCLVIYNGISAIHEHTIIVQHIFYITCGIAAAVRHIKLAEKRQGV